MYMIMTFADKYTESIFKRILVRKFSEAIQNLAYRKLLMIDAAEKIDDLRIPPGNRLEKLSGNLSGKYSIRINDQFRIVFSWENSNAYEVEIIDYH